MVLYAGEWGIVGKSIVGTCIHKYRPAVRIQLKHQYPLISLKTVHVYMYIHMYVALITIHRSEISLARYIHTYSTYIHILDETGFQPMRTTYTLTDWI